VGRGKDRDLGCGTFDAAGITSLDAGAVNPDPPSLGNVRIPNPPARKFRNIVNKFSAL
jgi:hypothetical protein